MNVFRPGPDEMIRGFPRTALRWSCLTREETLGKTLLS